MLLSFTLFLLSASAAWAAPNVIEGRIHGSHPSDAGVLQAETHFTQQLNKTGSAFEADSDSRMLEPNLRFIHTDPTHQN